MRTNFDHFVDNWDSGGHSYTTAREAAVVANQAFLDEQTAEYDRQQDVAQFTAG